MSEAIKPAEGITRLSDHRARRSKGVADGGGPPHDSGMEARVAVLEEIAKATKESLGRIETKLETIRDKMERDFRLTFGAIIAVALGLAFVIAKGLKWF